MTRRQAAFIQSDAFETLFGGAAGGGKSHGQLLDALRFAVVYPGSRQLMLRRTMPELDRSLIPASLRLYPQSIANYKVSDHLWQFVNGSSLEFGYCDAESDVTKYQSAEYDVIRFDELTHFTESQFTYLLSRVRGTNGFPKQVKSTTNPGGVGHQWVKTRYIDPAPPDIVAEYDGGTRIFLPARLSDNPFLQKTDRDYEKRLRLLSPHDRKALLDGVWELNEGQYFSEFSVPLHVTPPYVVPKHWRRYLTIDYGLDMLAALWIAQSPDGYSVVYKELYQSGLIISEAAAAILSCEPSGEHIDCRLAPPDLWNRRQETGKSAVELFADCGLDFDRSSNERVAGWLALHELLAPRKDEHGAVRPKLTIFDTCRNLIRTLPALQHDARNPSDVANTPHELTHAPDALRGYAATIYEPPAPVQPTAYDCEIGEFLAY